MKIAQKELSLTREESFAHNRIPDLLKIHHPGKPFLSIVRSRVPAPQLQLLTLAIIQALEEPLVSFH